jgi:peptide/nickel transport system substrate-binding protein
LFGYGKIAGAVIAPANEFGSNPDIKPYPFDMEKARAILKEAGYQWDKEGRLCYPAD